jgi:hypothetical protein
MRSPPICASVRKSPPSTCFADQGLQNLRDRDGLGEAVDALAATGDSNPCPGCSW